MKKKLCVLSFASILLLSGCSFLGYSLNNSSNGQNSGGNTNNSQVTTEEENVKESYVLDGKKLKLNNYGDYVEYLDSSKTGEDLLKEYTSLKKKVKGPVYNDVMQSSYQKGLLDFFDINNKVEVIIDISSSELKKLDNDYSENGSNTESFRICNLDIIMNGMKIHYEEVGIRQKGNLSRKNQLVGNDPKKIKYVLEKAVSEAARRNIAGRRRLYGIPKGV